MTEAELCKTAERLEKEITMAPADARLRLQPEFARVIDKMKAAGLAVPARMRSLDVALTEEAIEDRFDNMPV